MVKGLLLAATGLFAIPAIAQPVPVSLKAVSAAQPLFERDWVLMNWALKFHDANRDIQLEPSEAASAAAEFREIADADNDGRITPQEYRVAREFLLARY
jgi:hypothetical protein